MDQEAGGQVLITPEMRIEYIDFEEVRKWPRNPKDHDSMVVQKSMSKFGFTNPVILDDNSGRLVAGHGRLEALRRLKKSGHNAPTRVRVEGDKWLVPVVRGVTFESESDAEAYLLLDNRSTEIGGWQEDMLGQVLAEMDTSLHEYTGFFKDEISDLIKEIAPEATEAVEELPTPRAELCQQKWQVKYGDIWDIGKHRLVCIDFRTDWLNIKDQIVDSVQGVFTSPPYGKQRARQYGGVEMDKYSEWWYHVQKNCKAMLSPKGHFFINIKASIPNSGKYKYQRHWYVHQLVLDMIKKWDWKYMDEYIWTSTSPPKQVKRRFKNFFEPVFWFTLSEEFDWYPHNVLVESESPIDRVTDKPKEWKNTAWDNVQGESIRRVPPSSRKKGYAYPSNVIKTGSDTSYGHPAPFPVALPEFFIKAMSKEGDTWFDPFCGSGTTIAAAEKNKRIAVGTEVKPEYVAVTLERLKYLKPIRRKGVAK